MNRSHVPQSKLNVPNYDHFEELRKLLEDTPGLSLEVEIDKDLEDLLGSEERLDVTIIEQSDSPKEATVSLNVNEVTDFIEMVNHASKNNKNFTTEKDKNCTAVFTGKKNKNCNDTDNDGSPTTVYTTPYTFNNMKQKLPCLNESNEDKPGTPCLCQHCGMVGVLVESQKRPAIPHSPNPKSLPTKHKKEKEKPASRTRSKSETNIALLKELNEKITNLEGRLNEHEEKTVRKDYFKFVIHKLLNQYSNKINELRQGHARPSANISTQYSKTTSRPYSRDRYQEPERDSTDKRKCKHERFRETREHKEYDKPKFRKEHNDVLKLPPNMDEIEYSRNVYSSNADHSPFKVKARRNDLDEVSSETIKKLCDLVYNRYNEKDGVEKRVVPKRYGEIPEKLLNSNGRRPEVVKAGGRGKDDKDKVDVSYVNPAAARNWCEESSEDVEFQRRVQGGKVRNRHTIQEKIKYLKTLAKKKNVDETELWNNILNQAKKHIKSNEDTVSIQLPSNGKSEEMSELELTLSNLKEIAKRARGIKKNKSAVSIDLNYSSDNYMDKRHNRRR